MEDKLRRCKASQVRQLLLARLARPACSSSSLAALLAPFLSSPNKTASLFQTLSEDDATQCPPGSPLSSLVKNKLRCYEALIECIMADHPSSLRYLSDYLHLVHTKMRVYSHQTASHFAQGVGRSLVHITKEYMPRMADHYQQFIYNFVVTLLRLCFDQLSAEPSSACSNIVLKTVESTQRSIINQNLPFILDFLVEHLTRHRLQDQMLLETVLLLLLDKEVDRMPRSGLQRVLDMAMLFNSSNKSLLPVQNVKLVLDIVYSACVQERQVVVANAGGIYNMVDKTARLYDHPMLNSSADSLAQLVQNHSQSQYTYEPSKLTSLHRPSETTRILQEEALPEENGVEHSIITSLQSVIEQQKVIINQQSAKTDQMQKQIMSLSEKVDTLEGLYLQKDQQIAALYDNIGTLMERMHQREMRREEDNGRSTPHLVPFQTEEKKVEWISRQRESAEQEQLEKYKVVEEEEGSQQEREVVEEEEGSQQEREEEESDQEQRPLRESISQDGDSMHQLYQSENDIVIDLQDEQVFLQIVSQTDRIQQYLSKIDDQSLGLLLNKFTEYLYLNLSSFLGQDSQTFSDILQWLEVFLGDQYYGQLVSVSMAKDLKVMLTRIVVAREQQMPMDKQSMVYSLINKLILKLNGYLSDD